MNNALEVRPLAVASDRGYSGFITAIGFEHRARFAADKIGIRGKRNYACGFRERQVIAYKENRDWFGKEGFRVEECDDSEFVKWSDVAFDQICSGGAGGARVCVDISSFSRIRIAALIDSARRHAIGRRVEMDIVYSGAEFGPPPEISVPNVWMGPIAPEFAGWASDPDEPAALVLGIGYEQDKAVGVVEYIEPAAVWIFEPSGHDPRYTDAIRSANEGLWKILAMGERLEYAVYRPFDCFARLESLTNGLRGRMRPVLVPFGPKIFAVCCLLVSHVHPFASVWRVSSGQFERAVDRVASGRMTGLRVVFSDR